MHCHTAVPIIVSGYEKNMKDTTVCTLSRLSQFVEVAQVLFGAQFISFFILQI